MGRILHTALLVALLTLPACSERAPEGKPPTPEQLPTVPPPAFEPPIAVDPPPEDLPLPESFERSLAKAPRRTRNAVLSTCVKWMRPDGTCEAKAVRLGQIRCWWKRGKRELKYTQDLGFKRRRAIDHRIMLLQNLCMEMHGWQRRDRRAKT